VGSPFWSPDPGRAVRLRQLGIGERNAKCLVVFRQKMRTLPLRLSKVYYSAWVYVYPRCTKMSYSAKYKVRNSKCKYMCKYVCRSLVSATDVATELHPACCCRCTFWLEWAATDRSLAAVQGSTRWFGWGSVG